MTELNDREKAVYILGVRAGQISEKMNGELLPMNSPHIRTALNILMGGVVSPVDLWKMQDWFVENVTG